MSKMFFRTNNFNIQFLTENKSISLSWKWFNCALHHNCVKCFPKIVWVFFYFKYLDFLSANTQYTNERNTERKTRILWKENKTVWSSKRLKNYSWKKFKDWVLVVPLVFLKALCWFISSGNQGDLCNLKLEPVLIQVLHIVLLIVTFDSSCIFVML